MESAAYRWSCDCGWYLIFQRPVRAVTCPKCGADAHHAPEEKPWLKSDDLSSGSLKGIDSLMRERSSVRFDW